MKTAENIKKNSYEKKTKSGQQMMTGGGEGGRTLNIIEKHQIEMKIKVHACQMGNRMQPNWHLWNLNTLLSAQVAWKSA